MFHSVSRLHRGWLRLGSAVAMLSLVAVSCSSDASDTAGSIAGTTAPADAATTTTPAFATATTAAATAPTTAGTGPGPGQHGNGPLTVTSDGSSHVQHERMQDGLSALPLDNLSTADREGLIYMREEEKLAHDVYQVLADTWNRPIFTNIATAEATHTDAVMLLLSRHSILDPSATRPPGEFQNATLQGLYGQFTTRGAASLIEALRVGAEIEDLDIADLRARATSTADITLVYDNLELASRNHLRAFVAELAKLGVTYQPVHLPQADYDSIIASPIEG
ncbi:unannotated protein [freshwater metagenome]|uniref:Unannotated protein n=1 Tax=freshwater metagenome TaxID=449393 RepID=A0A6J7FML8_9ZZZZ